MSSAATITCLEPKMRPEHKVAQTAQKYAWDLQGHIIIPIWEAVFQYLA